MITTIVWFFFCSFRTHIYTRYRIWNWSVIIHNGILIYSIEIIKFIYSKSPREILYCLGIFDSLIWPWFSLRNNNNKDENVEWNSKQEDRLVFFWNTDRLVSWTFVITDWWINKIENSLMKLKFTGRIENEILICTNKKTWCNSLKLG